MSAHAPPKIATHYVFRKTKLSAETSAAAFEAEFGRLSGKLSPEDIVQKLGELDAPELRAPRVTPADPKNPTPTV